VLPVPLSSAPKPPGPLLKKGEPECLGRRGAGCETSSQGGRQYARRSHGREGQSFDRGRPFGDLKLEVLDAAQMDDLGGVTDEILAAQMEILAENEVTDSGEDTVGEYSEDEESFSEKGAHNPVSPDVKSGARMVYLGQEGDKMHLDYGVAVHGDGKGGPPFYTAYLEGLGKNRLKDSDCFLLLLKSSIPPPLCLLQYHSTLLPGSLKPEKTKRRRRNISSRCLNWPRFSSSSVWKTRNLRKYFRILRGRPSKCL
jgi:hypothetical protein